MFDVIFKACEEMGIYHLSKIISATSQLEALFVSDYMKDKNARNAAIDAICQYLQKQKE